MVTAVIMAGGKGTRMEFKGEKPLISVRGKPMIRHVCEAVHSSREVDDLVVAPVKTHHSPLILPENPA